MTNKVPGKLPAILQRRSRSTDSPVVAVEKVFALAEYCNATWLLNAYLAEPEESDRKSTLYLLYMHLVGHVLIQRFIPAYRPSRSRIGRSDVTIDDWVAAGGEREDIEYASPYFYAAQFVQLVDAVAREKKKRREWVFRWLVNKEAVGGAKEAERRIAMVPKPFRQRRTKGSLKEAFSRIPTEVKKKPCDYLPTRLGFRLAVAMTRAQMRHQETGSAKSI